LGAFYSEGVRHSGDWGGWGEGDDQGFGGLLEGDGCRVGAEEGYSLYFGVGGREGFDGGGSSGGVAVAERVEVAVHGGEAEAGVGEGDAGGGAITDCCGLIGGGASLPVGWDFGGRARALAGDAPGVGIVDGFAIGFEPFSDGEEDLLLDLRDAAVAHGRDVEHEISVKMTNFAGLNQAGVRCWSRMETQVGLNGPSRSGLGLA
jgi:hypothetical protein